MQELSNVLAGKYEEVVEKITSFSNEYLNDEYKNVCIEAAKTLFLNNEENVKKGKSFSWAAGIVHAIGSLNNLFDSKEQPYIKALDLYKEFGVSSSTGSSKSKEVKNLLGLSEDDNKWIVSNKSNNEKSVKEEAAEDKAVENKAVENDNTFRFAVSRNFVVAQKIMDHAWREKNYNNKVKIAKEAIKVYEDCPDAYIILSRDSRLNDLEKKELLERAVEAAKRSLRIEDLEKVDKRLFAVPLSKPFFGAKYTLAMHLWEMGERDSAIENLYDIINYDLSDHLLARAVLSGWLLIAERYDDAEKVLARYEKDLLAATNYNRAALLYKTNKTKEAESALRRAYKRNPFVIDCLLKRSKAGNSVQHIKIGTREEAMSYANLGLKIWNDSQMMSWLKEMKKNMTV